MSPFGAPPLLPPPLLPPLLPPQAATSASAAIPAAATVASFRPLSMSSPFDRTVAVTTRSARTPLHRSTGGGRHASDGRDLSHTAPPLPTGGRPGRVDRDARVMPGAPGARHPPVRVAAALSTRCYP